MCTKIQKYRKTRAIQTKSDKRTLFSIIRSPSSICVELCPHASSVLIPYSFVLMHFSYYRLFSANYSKSQRRMYDIHSDCYLKSPSGHMGSVVEVTTGN